MTGTQAASALGFREARPSPDVTIDALTNEAGRPVHVVRTFATAGTSVRAATLFTDYGVQRQITVPRVARQIAVTATLSDPVADAAPPPCRTDRLRGAARNGRSHRAACGSSGQTGQEAANPLPRHLRQPARRSLPMSVPTALISRARPDGSVHVSVNGVRAR